MSRRKRSPSRAAICWGERMGIRAAASSIASGTPSSRTQISATAAAFSGARAKAGTRVRARSRKSATAGMPASVCRSSTSPGSGRWGTGRGGTGKWCSQGTRSAMRLVTRQVSLAQAASRAARCGAAAETCSKLSRSSRAARSCRWSLRVSSVSRPGRSRRRNARAIAARTPAGSRTGARSTNQAPSGKARSTRRAISRARRVLPMPGGPVRVRRRTWGWAKSRAPVATSSSRPMRGPGWRGSTDLGIPPVRFLRGVLPPASDRRALCISLPAPSRRGFAWPGKDPVRVFGRVVEFSRRTPPRQGWTTHGSRSVRAWACSGFRPRTPTGPRSRAAPTPGRPACAAGRASGWSAPAVPGPGRRPVGRPG